MEIKDIIELGLIRKRNECAKCRKRMDRTNYNIQLCTSCRVTELKKEEIKMDEKMRVYLEHEIKFLEMLENEHSSRDRLASIRLRKSMIELRLIGVKRK